MLLLHSLQATTTKQLQDAASLISRKKRICRMNTAAVIRFPKPPLTKGAVVNIRKGEDGYTKTPNYLVDDDYVAKMTGNSLKCYVVINRFSEGFSRKNWAMESKFLQRKTGIKKPHTLFEAVKQLEGFGLLSVHREDGKTNKFTITHPCLKTAVPNIDTTAENGQWGSAENGHKTTAENGHTKKETLKENIKNKKNNHPVDNSETEMFGDSVKYHSDNSNLYTLRELASQYPVQSDLQAQAKDLNAELSDEIILAELKGFAQWSTGRSKTTAQNWMNFWIYRIQNLKVPKAKSQKPNKPKSKGLSDSQINYFVSELCNYGSFASKFSNAGEPQKSFEARISANLRNPEHIKKYGPYLHELGFVVDLEDFA